MKSLPVIRPHDAHYDRSSAFSYTCGNCSRCCYDKIIHLNPYEVARLARNRQMGTTEFLNHYTAENGTALRQKQDGACIFLTSQGCGVHPDRPLVCRLYPLGRRVTSEGEEWFEEMAPHPNTAGEYGTRGTVDSFLLRQDAQPFVEAVDRYVELAGRMFPVLRQQTTDDPELKDNIQSVVEKYGRENDYGVPGALDMDQAVEFWCNKQGKPVPEDIHEKMTLHIHMINEWLSEQ